MLREIYRRVVPAGARRAVRRLGAPAPPLGVTYELACGTQADASGSSWAKPSVTARFKQGLETFDLTRARREPASALASPIVCENLSMLERMRLDEATLLDFGCGNGLYRVVLAHHAATARWEYTGADVNRELVEWCRAEHAGARFEVVSESGPLPFGEGEFDVVLASGVLQYVARHEAALSELRRVTRGHLVVSRLPVWRDGPTRLVVQRVRHAWGRENHLLRVFNRGELEDLFARAGLAVAERAEGSEAFDVPRVAERAVLDHFLLRKVSGGGEPCG